MIETEKQRSAPSTVWKRLGVFLLVLLGALLSLSLIVHIPAVQRWGTRYISGYLTEKTGSTVTVKGFDFNAFSHIELEEVFISQEGASGDTLLYAGEFGMRFTKLWKLLSGKPEIGQVRLRHARLYIDDRPLTFLKLTGKKKAKSTGIQILHPEIVLDDIQGRISKSTQRMVQEFSLPHGSIQIDEINTELKILRLESINLQEPHLDLTVKPDSLIRIPHGTVPALARETARDASPWIFEFQQIKMTDGQLAYVNPDAEVNPSSTVIDYNNLRISDLQLDLRDFCIDSTRVTGQIRGISFAEQSGYRIEDIVAKHFSVSSEGIALGGIEIHTAGSAMMDSLALDFGNAKSEVPFAKRMSIYAQFKDTEVAFADLLATIPGLDKSNFFTRNRNETLKLSGVLRGPLDRIRGDSLTMQLGNMTFNGQFRSRDLTIHGKQILNLEVSDARLTAGDLEKHIPGIKLPEQFSRLGRMQFQGKFDGFLEDFVAFGRLNTDIGSAEVDINLETTGRMSTYYGSISLQNFNMKKWTDVADLGMISANLRLDNGSGLTPETAVADISGSISQFQYKGYEYSDVQIDGRLNQNQFNGKLEVLDPNVNLVFEGTVRANQGTPVFDFVADINQLDFKKLHLSTEEFSLSGSFVARGQGMDINTVTGSLKALDINVKRGDAAYALDTVDLDIERLDDGRRIIRSNSDYINGYISGDFALNTLYPSFAHFLEKSYPQYFSGIRYNRELSDSTYTAEFDVTLNHPAEWGGLFNLNNLHFSNLHAQGSMNLMRDSVLIDITAPDLHFGKVNAYHIKAHLESIAGQAKAETFVTAIDVKEKYFFDEITASIRTNGEGFNWSLGADDLFEELNTLGLSGTFYYDSNQISTLHIDPQIIEILKQKWEIREGNQIMFGKNFIELNDVVFRHEDQVISITDIDSRGIMIETQQFDLHIIDDAWDYAKLDFGGAYALRAGIDDIFKRENFYVFVDAPDVRVNGDSYGVMYLSCHMAKMGSPVVIDLSLNRPGVHVAAKGAYFPPVPEMEENLRNTLDVELAIDTFPLAFLEYILKGGIHHTTGYTVGEMHIGGTLSSTKMDGHAKLYEGATTVTYLGTRYAFHEQPVHITESVIDATGAILTDELGNSAVVEGGLTHRVLGRIGLNARIRSPRILALNTGKEDNTAYYGRGIGSVDAVFRGQVETPSISVNAITDQGSNIVINLADEGAARRQSFLRFRNETTNSEVDYKRQTSITGMNFEMNMSATPEAVVEIILEDNPPESIVGSGTGDIQLTITRTGDFTMYGQYEIETGSYLFRSFVVINKPFSLRRGGIIQWNGDPYNADINLSADYVGLRASVSPLLAEYLTNASDETREEASRKTKVDLRLLLTGTLLEPQINFDFSFPELSGELAGYADTKLRILKSNQNALNEQVFGLLWAGAFLPSNILQSDASVQLAQEGLTNSVSEFLSAQVSSMFSGMISRWVEDVDFISGIDFNVDYSQGSQFDVTEAGTSAYREWEVRVKNRLFNDRFIIDAGANYGTDRAIGTATYFVGDYALEYLLTQDGRLKIRFYQRSEPTIEGRKNKLGIGLAWRREFDSFEEWLGGLKNEAKKVKVQDQENN